LCLRDPNQLSPMSISALTRTILHKMPEVYKRRRESFIHLMRLLVSQWGRFNFRNLSRWVLFHWAYLPAALWQGLRISSLQQCFSHGPLLLSTHHHLWKHPRPSSPPTLKWMGRRCSGLIRPIPRVSSSIPVPQKKNCPTTSTLLLWPYRDPRRHIPSQPGKTAANFFLYGRH